MIRPAGTIEKRVAEKFPIGFRYRDPDLPSGVQIQGVVISVSPPGLTVGSGQVSGAEVFCWIEGGAAGTDYAVRFTTTLSDTKILVDDFVVKVR
jgi:hypothetical protein